MEALVEDIVSRRKLSLQEIPVYRLKRGQYQPRQSFSEDGLNALAETIRQVGILEPLVVRVLAKDQYEIIAGERRWRAAQIVGLDTVPCLIGNYDDVEANKIALIENLARENLNTIDLAEGIRRMIDEFNYKHEDAAKILGKPRSQVTNLLRLLKLDKRVQEYLRTGDITEAHGKVLAGLDIEKQYYFANLSVNKNLSIRALTKTVESEKRKINISMKKKNVSDPNIVKLEQEVSDCFGHKVKIAVEKKEKGHLTICFYNFDDLNVVLEKLGYSPNA